MENPLKKYRREHNLTLAEAGLLFDVHYTHVCRVEGGYTRPSAKMINRLGELGVDLPNFIRQWNEFVKARQAEIARRVTHADRPEEPAAALEVEA